MTDDNAPATKSDLRQLEERLGNQMGLLRDELVEKMRDLQTEVLRAFHNWASPVDIKLRGHEERLMLLEERVTQIERRGPAH